MCGHLREAVESIATLVLVLLVLLVLLLFVRMQRPPWLAVMCPLPDTGHTFGPSITDAPQIT